MLCHPTQEIFTCTKSTLEKGIKYVQCWKGRYQNKVTDVVLVSLLLNLNMFHFFSYYFHHFLEFPRTLCVCLQFRINIYLFKVNNRNIRKRWETRSKLTIKTPERGQWRRSGVFIVNFEHTSSDVSRPFWRPVYQLGYRNSGI